MKLKCRKILNQETLNSGSTVYKYFDLIGSVAGIWRRWLNEGLCNLSFQQALLVLSEEGE
jgi:hypothetical protein